MCRTAPARRDSHTRTRGVCCVPGRGAGAHMQHALQATQHTRAIRDVHTMRTLTSGGPPEAQARTRFPSCSFGSAPKETHSRTRRLCSTMPCASPVG
eukprot:3863966-Prymnesium_polylepis.1